jgi:hypothetical protein
MECAMAWVVTSWRHEALQAAERRARQLERRAAREIADADAYLTALERFGVDTRREVRRWRVALRTDGSGASVEVRETAPARPARPARRTDRARLRDSPLAELFRATGEQ